jgi:hypothetical protein
MHSIIEATVTSGEGIIEGGCLRLDRLISEYLYECLITIMISKENSTIVEWVGANRGAEVEHLTITSLQTMLRGGGVVISNDSRSRIGTNGRETSMATISRFNEEVVDRDHVKVLIDLIETRFVVCSGSEDIVIIIFEGNDTKSIITINGESISTREANLESDGVGFTIEKSGKEELKLTSLHLIEDLGESRSYINVVIDLAEGYNDIIGTKLKFDHIVGAKFNGGDLLEGLEGEHKSVVDLIEGGTSGVEANTKGEIGFIGVEIEGEGELRIFGGPTVRDSLKDISDLLLLINVWTILIHGEDLEMM